MLDSESSESSTKVEESGERVRQEWKGFSIIDMCQDDPHVDVNVQLKEVPFMWIGKKWLEFLSN